MKVIIAGCGRVGALLAVRLRLDGHELSVIDQNPDAFRRLGQGFGGTTHRGKSFDRATMIDAGIEHADAFVAVTSGDNSNVVAALAAREAFRVPRVIARIYEPRRAEIYRRLGVVSVSSVAWAVNEVRSLLHPDRLTQEVSFGDGEVRLISALVPPRLDGRPVDHLARHGVVVPLAIVRSGASRIAAPGTLLASGDTLYLAVSTEALESVQEMLAP